MATFYRRNWSDIFKEPVNARTARTAIRAVSRMQFRFFFKKENFFIAYTFSLLALPRSPAGLTSKITISTPNSTAMAYAPRPTV